jgi:hypothetical protein
MDKDFFDYCIERFDAGDPVFRYVDRLDEAPEEYLKHVLVTYVDEDTVCPIYIYISNEPVKRVWTFEELTNSYEVLTSKDDFPYLGFIDEDEVLFDLTKYPADISKYMSVGELEDDCEFLYLGKHHRPLRGIWTYRQAKENGIIDFAKSYVEAKIDAEIKGDIL